MTSALVSLACAAVLAVAGCSETDNDKPRFTADAWVEFQRRDDAFVARASRMLDRFVTCAQRAKSDDAIEECGFPLEQNGNGLANEYSHCWDCSGVGGEEDIYDNITTDSPCWVTLRGLYEMQQDIGGTLSDLGRGFYALDASSTPLDRDRLVSAVYRKMDQLAEKRDRAHRRCSPQP